MLADFSMVRRTANSGAVFGDGDGRHGRFIIECKDEQGEAIRFPYAQYQKIRSQAWQHRVPHWVRFFRNGKGDRVVSMDYELAKLLLSVACNPLECPSCGTQYKVDW